MNTGTTKRNLLQAFNDTEVRRTEDDAAKLARVAEMMDVWTRNENKYYQEDQARMEDAMLRMAGTIATLEREKEERLAAIQDLEAERVDLITLIEHHEDANRQMQGVVTLYNRETNELVPSRRFEHRLARNTRGVVFPVMMARPFHVEVMDANTENEGMEVIDLTTESDSEEEQFQETLRDLADM